MPPHSTAESAPSPPKREPMPSPAKGGGQEDQRELRRRVTHLVVMQHGLHGSERDLEHFERLFALHFREEGVYVHCGQCNAETFFQTYDGVDQGGERLANEVQALAKEMPNLRKFSMVGHSLGGLYNRYCIGLLYARCFFKDVEPVVSDSSRAFRWVCVDADAHCGVVCVELRDARDATSGDPPSAPRLVQLHLERRVSQGPEQVRTEAPLLSDMLRNNPDIS